MALLGGEVAGVLVAAQSSSRPSVLLCRHAGCSPLCLRENAGLSKGEKMLFMAMCKHGPTDLQPVASRDYPHFINVARGRRGVPISAPCWVRPVFGSPGRTLLNEAMLAVIMAASCVLHRVPLVCLNFNSFLKAKMNGGDLRWLQRRQSPKVQPRSALSGGSTATGLSRQPSLPPCEQRPFLL